MIADLAIFVSPVSKTCYEIPKREPRIIRGNCGILSWLSKEDTSTVLILKLQFNFFHFVLFTAFK